MHIQEGTNTTLTTCTKMTEEVDRRHGVNGNSKGVGVNDESPVPSPTSASGGRLKFFKDGKFILELVRGSAREGESPGWVSVPRKTFWPPAAPPPPPTHTAQLPRAERANSLSVSDDNSSIQSSPWQRDHCWKQTSPRRNISKELTMYYCRPSALSSATIAAGARRKRRRPRDTEHYAAILRAGRGLTNGHAETNGEPARADDAERYHHKLKKPQQHRKLRVYRKTRPPRVRGGHLAASLERLRARLPAAAAAAATAVPLPPPAPHPALASCRAELPHPGAGACVSPRKRILRELERVSLDERAQQAAHAEPAAPGKRRARHAPALPAPAPPLAAAAPPAAAPGPSRVSSYSIHSLLSMPEPAGRESAEPAPAPDASVSPDPYRYRYAAPALPAGPQRRSPPSPAPAPYRLRRDDWPYLPYYAGYLPPPAYRPPPLYYYAAPLPPGAWAPLPHPHLPAHHPAHHHAAHPAHHALHTLSEHAHKDDHTSDVPLNLSKH